MKRARIVAAAFEVLCPTCSEPQSNVYDGSHLWADRQLTEADKPGTQLHCTCGATFVVRVPRVLRV